MSLSPREEAMMDAIGKCMIEEIERAVAPLRERIAELEKGGIRYMGTHQRAQEYKRGSMVTHDGSLWCAVTDTKPNQVPGNGDVWQLAVKSPQQPRSPTMQRTQGFRP